MKNKLSDYKNIVVLTGAGISVGSGLPPYRGPGGIWTTHNVALYGTKEGLVGSPEKVWELFGPMRELIALAKPNPGHLALAAFEAGLREDQNFLLVTQNVDGLHQRAGSKNVVEIHGSMSRSLCSSCDLPAFDDTQAHTDALPLCPSCGKPLRPDVVLFNERIPALADWTTKKALRDCDLFIAIGTSGTVASASGMVRSAKFVGARTLYVNLVPMDPVNPAFDESYIGEADKVLPELLQT